LVPGSSTMNCDTMFRGSPSARAGRGPATTVMRDPATILQGSSTATPLASRISGATETVTGNEAAAVEDGDGEGEEDGEAEVEWVRRCARWGRAAAKAEASMVVVVEDELGWWKRMEGTASGPRRGKAGLCGRSGEDGWPPPPQGREGGGWGGGIGVDSAWPVRLRLRGWE
jgi:hypothetical protein